MLKRNCLMVSLLLTCLLLIIAMAAQAAPVGNLTQVEGSVDLLKGGKVPAVPAKVQEGVEVGDMVRTKADSRAEIRFVDNTVLTIAPESGITIEDYMFDAATSSRKAVVDVVRGLVHTAVEKANAGAEPDFIMKTHTAVLGVRGTKWYTKLTPTATDIYTEEAKLEVKKHPPGNPRGPDPGEFPVLPGGDVPAAHGAHRHHQGKPAAPGKADENRHRRQPARHRPGCPGRDQLAAAVAQVPGGTHPDGVPGERFLRAAPDQYAAGHPPCRGDGDPAAGPAACPAKLANWIYYGRLNGYRALKGPLVTTLATAVIFHPAS